MAVDQFDTVNLFLATAAGSVSLMKAKWPGTYTLSGPNGAALPDRDAGSIGITLMTESGATVGGVFSPDTNWQSVTLNFAGVGAADLTATVEIGRLMANGTMPNVIGNATTLKSITTSGTFTANFNPFTGAAVASTTFRLFDLITLNSKSSLGELLVNTGGVEDETPASLQLDVTQSAYYYVLCRGLGTLTSLLCAITPQP